MGMSCEVVRDLLPLYHDGVCSADSRTLIGEHLSGCEPCKSELEKLKDNTLDRRIQTERNDVVRNHAKAVMKKSFIAGISAASVLGVPILVCLIVNLATGHTLDWFFIVLTAIMTLASVTVVPLVMEQRKELWTLGAFTGSLILLLLTCCLYSGGDWFFVAVIPVLFGLSVVFAPFVVYALPLKGAASRHKGLLVMAADAVLLYAVIVVSGLYSGFGAGDWRNAMVITTISSLLPWTLFMIIRYAKSNGFVKAGLCTVIGSIFVSVLDSIIGLILGEYQHHKIMFTNANFFNWNQMTLDANIRLIVLITGVTVGGILLAGGVLRKKK